MNCGAAQVSENVGQLLDSVTSDELEKLAEFWLCDMSVFYPECDHEC